eukprot:SAG31_NODE_29034_length_401_cov_15.655629_1_plen_57_part_01
MSWPSLALGLRARPAAARDFSTPLPHRRRAPYRPALTYRLSLPVEVSLASERTSAAR